MRRLLLLAALGASLSLGQTLEPQQVLDRYLSAPHIAEPPGSGNDVEIQALLPKLRKSGTMHAIRQISAAGRVTYSMLRFTGDDVIRRMVIARYLSGDIQAHDDAADASISARNYRFHFLRTEDYSGRTASVFRVTPRHRRTGLYRGELWLDAENSAVLREWGELAKSPSLWITRVHFVRDYLEQNGTSHPCRLLLTTRTRLAGPAELTIRLTPSDDLARPVLYPAFHDETSAYRDRESVQPGGRVSD